MKILGFLVRWAGVSLLALCTPSAGEVHASEVQAPSATVSARGRIQPKDGVRSVAGPSQQAIFVNVLGDLYVSEGDSVKAGDVIAILDNHRIRQAAVVRLRSKLTDTERELTRGKQLRVTKVISQAEYEKRETARDIVSAELDYALAELELTLVRAPISGKVLKIYAHPGERVALDGILEIGQTDAMYVVAEVYETDVHRVHVGASAVATTPSLQGELAGSVEEIGWRVGKMDVLDSDPAARTDARVVEVTIRLDESARVERLTNMQVDVKIAAEPALASN